MTTTKPFLVLDLEKSWKEENHPRDSNGKFTRVRGGSRVATKTGKTGVVRKVTDEHYLIDYDDGKKARVKKENVLHANDIKKSKPVKERKAKEAGKKQSATKAANKANGTAKAALVVDPTAKKVAAKKAEPVKPKGKKVPKAVKDTSQKELQEAQNAGIAKIEAPKSGELLQNHAQKAKLEKERDEISARRKSKKRTTELERVRAEIYDNVKERNNINEKYRNLVDDYRENSPVSKELKRKNAEVHAIANQQAVDKQLESTHQSALKMGGYDKAFVAINAKIKEEEAIMNRKNSSESAKNSAKSNLNMYSTLLKNFKQAELKHGNKPKAKKPAAPKAVPKTEAPKLTVAATKNTGLDSAWNSKDVKALLKQPAEKRNQDKIAQIAGKITADNDKLAHSLVNRRLKALGMPHMKNVVGGKAYETGIHGDLLQSARGAMYETVHATLAGTQNPGTAIGAHVTNRMKDKINIDLYSTLNAIPAPHEVRPAIRAMKREETALALQLGHTPSDKELGAHLQANSEHFRDAPINVAPRWDEKTGDWKASKDRIKDPTERLKMLRQYDSVQRTTSADRHIGSDGENEVTVTGNAVDEGRTPDELYERKERQKELEGTLPSAMRQMGMEDASVKVWTLTHSGASGNRGQYSGQEVADHINAEGGWNGKKISRSWVAQRYAEGRKAIEQAIKDNHPAIAQLRLMKSFVFTEMLKAVYEFNLVKSLNSWGFDHSILEREFVRTESGRSVYDIKKSLDPTEYIGSIVTVDSGQVHARIVRNTVPKGESLLKAFADFEELNKALFPHKDGGNHAVNSKAGEHIKANAGKYKGMASDQATRIKNKSGKVTWSEQLVLDNPGSAWIRWGGKRILIHSDTGEVLYDSKNDAHRESHNEGAQEDKLEFQHETDEAEDKKKELMEEAKKLHAEGKTTLKGGRSEKKWAEHYGVKTKEVEGEGGKKELHFERDEEGNLTFDHSNHNFVTDHGTQAFEEGLSELATHIKEHKLSTIDEVHHKAVGMYGKLSDEEKAAYDGMSKEEREHFIGSKIANDDVRELLERARSLAEGGMKGGDIHSELADELKELGGATDSMTLVNKGKMTPVLNALGKNGDIEDAIRYLGAQEISRGREEANKKMLPVGHYEMGNKQTGQVMVVKIGHREDPDTGAYMSYVEEAFDPKTGKHFTSGNDVGRSWGQLGRELGLKNNSAEAFIYDSNKSGNDAVVASMSDADALELRNKTTLGLRDSMAHKDFAMVDQNVGKDGKVTSTTYAQDMPDGTQNVIEVGADGYIKDPIMARLVGNRDPIHTADDLHEALQGAVGNTTWVTAHAGSDVHIGDALGHHVKLMYDGKGAPRVTGGQYDGYRFMDSKDVPKGAVDPMTGEPIKTLFKNGKLVDRKFSKQNDLEMKKGNAVMFPDGDGGHKRGRISSMREDGTFEVLNGQGQLVGLFNKKELKPAKAAGRTLADSGKAVVQLKESQAHRMRTSEVFEDNEKAAELFKQALTKAKVKSAFDKETGELNRDLDLSDKEHQALKKILGRSKAGKEMMKQFNSSQLPSQLELHVPEHLRSEVEAEGVAVGKNGRAIISAGKFEQLRDVLGGLSLDHKAQNYMKDHFRRKDRTPRPIEELKKDYQPSQAEGVHADEFRKQFKPDSFLMNPEQGLYGTQLEGVAHLVERGRGIAGHGMGTGKTILGIMAGLHHKASMKAIGQKAGKTLVVAPKGIMSDWGKEIGSHTNSKALYIGSGFKSDKKAENGRKLWGQEGTEQEAVDYKSFKKNSGVHAGEDHDFHIVSYDTFMRNKDHFANSGMYDNIAIDEVHAFKNQGGKRGGSLAEVTDKFKNVWGLSGTPMENDAREIHSLIDTVTGGKHELGSKKEFVDNYMIKDRKGKIVGVKPEEDQPEGTKLGDVMANVVQFRGGEDVKYNDGSKIHFPHLAGANGTEDNPNPQQDFIGNMVDKSRDHQTTDYYGTKHSITDFDKGTKEVTASTGDKYTVDTHMPKGVDPKSAMGKMYSKYNELQQKYLPESKLAELQTATATGFDNATGAKNQNYLTAMQKLQKFVNAPLSDKMYVPGGNALDSDSTNVQAEAKGKKSKAEPIPFETDADGNKRYYEADGKGGHLTNADGSPKLLPPLHHENPKAQYLQSRVSQYLDQVQGENAERRRTGKPEIMPKVVVKSAYTTFGTDIVDGVLRDLQRDHPELQRWAAKSGEGFGAGRFTGDADDREDTKTGFRGNKKDYAKEQGNLWATTVSPAGKEGVDFGNAHYMIHFDQEWNPQKMAQFTARVRRSDSAKTHAQVDRANAVRVESLHMPGTVEDFMFDAQDKKMESINQVTASTRNAEQAPKLGDTQSGVGRSYRGFTRGGKNRAGAKPKDNVSGTQVTKPKAPSRKGGSRDIVAEGGAAAVASKALKLVVLL